MKGISAINELNQKGELNANRAGGEDQARFSTQNRFLENKFL